MARRDPHAAAGGGGVYALPARAFRQGDYLGMPDDIVKRRIGIAGDLPAGVADWARPTVR